MTTACFYGHRLRLARYFHGYTLEEVGDAVAATRQYIQQIETNADKQPTQEMLLALAHILEVKPAFFLQHEPNQVSDEQFHFRKVRSTPVNTKNQALAHGVLFGELVEGLEDALSLPEVEFPSLTPSSMADIERVAEACRIHWGLGVTGPINNMVRVVENAGAMVTYFKGVSEKIDAFSMERRRPLIIRNPAKESACRMRFDIAHECGHLVMHKGVHTGDKLTEDQANRFASAFLLPRVAFLKEFPKSRRLSWPRIYDLKLRWKVAASAIVRRAYDLGVIDAAQYRTANVRLRKTGESKCERYDVGEDAIPMEAPELLPNAFEVLAQDAPQEIYRLEERLQITRHLLEKMVDQKLKIDDFSVPSDNTKIISFQDYKAV